jgi:hypothetical protein
MLTEICDYIHNYFEYATYHGDFEITDGTIDLSGLVLDGQRFRIIGSAMNDGIYTYHTDGTIYDDDGKTEVSLSTESFSGDVIAMYVPKAILSLADEISAWLEKNKDVLNSPYTSESFGGYSYTKASGSGANAGGILGWQDVFKSRLNAYRKIA